MRALWLAVTVTLAGCDRGAPPAAPSGAPRPAVDVQIAPPAGNAAVVGMTVPLAATVSIGGVPQLAALPAIQWSSSNPGVARVDARGLLTGVSPGQAVVTAAVENASATLAVEVVSPLAGDITMTWTPASCTQFHSTCLSGAPDRHTSLVTVTQIGGRIDAVWKSFDVMSGRVPFSGRIHADDTIDLSGSRCSLDDFNRGTRFSLTDWRMQRRADGVYTGRLQLVQENTCDASATSRIVTDYVIELRP